MDDRVGVSGEIQRLREQGEEVLAALQPVMAEKTRLYKEAASRGVTAALRDAIVQVEEKLQAGSAELSRIGALMLEVSGIPLETIEAFEAEVDRGDEIDRLPRSSIVAEEIEPTALLENLAPAALDRLLSLVDTKWLRAEGEKGYRVQPSLLREPLVLIRGSRPESELRPIHRFAQSLLVTGDFLRKELAFDWFAGALLVPETVALGNSLEALSEVSGDLDERLSALWRYPSESTGATVYELLVAASCTRYGRRMEFLTAGKSTSGAKTPDLRVHGYPFPVVVECKRRQALTPADIQEARRMREVFEALQAACARRGQWGIFNLRLTVTPAELPVQQVVDAGLRQRYAIDPAKYVEHSWGRIAFDSLPARLTVPETRVYSPNFLDAVFGWNTDLPPHDGLACQVRNPGDLIVTEARDPLALFWTNEEPSAFLRRARTPSELFGKAVGQIPPGEVGVIFLCYQEGDRQSVADNRADYMTKQLRDWTHVWTAIVPILLITRLVPRPLDHGRPDLIETGIRCVSEARGSGAWFRDFPSTVFTW
jgi:hypothetical protein